MEPGQGSLEGTTPFEFKHLPTTILGYRKNGMPIYPIMGGDENDNPPGGGDNPAWSSFLGVIPEEYHEAVKPVLQEWDKGVQDRFQKVHSEYEPWKEIITSPYDPDTVKMATDMLGMLQTDPRSLYDALGENFGFATQDPEGEVEDPENPEQGQTDDFWNDPRIQQLAANQERVNQILMGQFQQQLEQREEAALDQELTALREKVGDFDESDLIRRMLTDDKLTVESAYEAQIKDYDRIRNMRPTPPKLIGGGSGQIPAPNIDPGKMSRADTKNLIVQTLLASRGEQ